MAASASAGRRAFTVLHEFGHHLQQHQTTLADLLLEQPDGGIALEDAACDGFAAEILLPVSLVDRFIGARGPTGAHVVDLWRASVASRAAACVRAAQRLASPGHIMLLDRDGKVSFCTSVGLPPIARGSTQGDIGTVREALAGSGRATGRTRLRYRDGIRGDELYAQVVPMDGYLLLVAVIDGAPWLSFSPAAAVSGPVAASWVCEHTECAHEFVSFETRCPGCRGPACPQCQRCQCPPRVREQTCPGCFQRLPAATFPAGSPSCSECS
ncbi:ImmA/IrrE family metallo-endopeptidase [Planobispora rosea]|uniref:ImmA/IrrE family metallo-endopeptidase n=1 Tax=Planobispora rosea TaxID=35762 RepID=UPI00083B09DA|nr:ImmA/IrrE family metallo-endopeptidase [Planobispora rosea]